MSHPDDWWKHLVASLDGWSGAKSQDAGHIEVVIPQEGTPRHAVIIMNAEEWDDMVSISWGSLDAAVSEVKRVLTSLGPDEGYAVYSQYRLEPSTTPDLPRMDDLPAGPGEWVVLDSY